jgi:uroporphyrinogen-III synthase
MSSDRLAGRGVLITRPAGLGEPLAQLVRAQGGCAVVFPAIEILPPSDPRPLQAVIERLHTFDWSVFVSPTAAREGVHAVQALRPWPAQPRLAAIGRGTAAALSALGFDDITAPEAPGDTEALLALPAFQQIAGDNILVFRGEGGREKLARTLAERGARVEYAECYRRARPEADVSNLLAHWRRGSIHAVCAASRESLVNLRDMLGQEAAAMLQSTPVFVPHPRVANAARELGCARAIVVMGGDSSTLEALAAFFAKV